MFAVMSRLSKHRRVLLGLLMLVHPMPLSAQSTSYQPDSVAQIDVLPGWRDASGRHTAAIRIRLADGWKTYWRAPGEAGIPPSFDWSGSRNLASVEFHWPRPEVFIQNGMRTIGYKHELILPMELTPKNAGRKISLRAQISLGVCRDVCMPMQSDLSATLPAQIQGPSPMIKRALDSRPDTAAEAGVGTVSCDVKPIADGLRLTARMVLPSVGHNEVAVIETSDQSVWVSEAATTRRGKTLTATADLVPSEGAPFLLNRSDVRITVLAGARAVDIMGCGS